MHYLLLSSKQIVRNKNAPMKSRGTDKHLIKAINILRGAVNTAVSIRCRRRRKKTDGSVSLVSVSGVSAGRSKVTSSIKMPLRVFKNLM